MGLFFVFYCGRQPTTQPAKPRVPAAAISNGAFSDRTSANQSRKRGPSRDQSFLTYCCLSIRCFGTGRTRAGDRRYIEDHVRAVHCYAESRFDRDLAERILPRRQTCLNARREPIRRECAKFQSRMPIAGQFQKTNHAAYRKHAGEIGWITANEK